MKPCTCIITLMYAPSQASASYQACLRLGSQGRKGKGEPDGLGVTLAASDSLCPTSAIPPSVSLAYLRTPPPTPTSPSATPILLPPANSRHHGSQAHQQGMSPKPPNEHAQRAPLTDRPTGTHRSRPVCNTLLCLPRATLSCPRPQYTNNTTATRPRRAALARSVMIS
jgi:hypothetical protein